MSPPSLGYTPYWTKLGHAVLCHAKTYSRTVLYTAVPCPAKPGQAVLYCTTLGRAMLGCAGCRTDLGWTTTSWGGCSQVVQPGCAVSGAPCQCCARPCHSGLLKTGHSVPAPCHAVPAPCHAVSAPYRASPGLDADARPVTRWGRWAAPRAHRADREGRTGRSGRSGRRRRRDGRVQHPAAAGPPGEHRERGTGARRGREGSGGSAAPVRLRGGGCSGCECARGGCWRWVLWVQEVGAVCRSWVLCVCVKKWVL